MRNYILYGVFNYKMGLQGDATWPGYVLRINIAQKLALKEGPRHSCMFSYSFVVDNGDGGVIIEIFISKQANTWKRTEKGGTTRRCWKIRRYDGPYETTGCLKIEGNLMN